LGRTLIGTWYYGLWDFNKFIPEGWPRIAQRFNTGYAWPPGLVPKGRLTQRASVVASGLDAPCQRSQR
jgi:hypothetical protein